MHKVCGDSWMMPLSMTSVPYLTHTKTLHYVVNITTHYLNIIQFWKQHSNPESYTCSSTDYTEIQGGTSAQPGSQNRLLLFSAIPQLHPHPNILSSGSNSFSQTTVTKHIHQTPGFCKASVLLEKFEFTSISQ